MLFYTPEAKDAFMARSTSFVYRQKVNKAVWNDLQRFDLNPELPKFTFPTLVVTGRYDFNVAPSVAWAIHNAIPGSELAIFEKSGHLPFCEESDAFLKRVEAFLLEMIVRGLPTSIRSANLPDAVTQAPPQECPQGDAIGVAHARRDLIDALVARLQQMHRALHAQTLKIG